MERENEQLRAKRNQIQTIIGEQELGVIASSDAVENFARSLSSCALPQADCETVCNGQVGQLKQGVKVHVRFSKEGWYEGVYYNEQVWFQDGEIVNIRLIHRWHLAPPIVLQR